MREKYETLSATVLKDLCKVRGIKGVSKMKKEELIEAMLRQDEIDAKNKSESSVEKTAEGKKSSEEKRTSEKKNASEEKKPSEGKNSFEEKKSSEEKMKDKKVIKKVVKSTPNQPNKEKPSTKENTSAKEETSGEEEKEIPHYDDEKSCSGILEVLSEGYGFIRCENYMPGENDVYVSPSQIRRFNLKTGDIVTGRTRKNNPNDKYGALLFMNDINGYTPEQAAKRPNFEDLTPIFPEERIRLERPGCSVAMRLVDLISPIGKGQRGMIVSQPKAGKTTLLKQVAKSITATNPDMHLIILLIDERPEEVTDMKEAIEGRKVEVIYSTFDEKPEHHKRVSEMVIERARRLVEHGEDVVILLDSITRLARAYNLTVQPSGRTLSGGLDPAALHMPKRFFGAARNMREGGSLTILATALVDTGSKMDDVVFEEFKGTGNMELVLDRKLSEKRVFPAIDLAKSSTRREDKLLSKREQDAMDIIRKALNGMRKDDAVENIINMFTHTKNNGEVVELILRRRMI
ncbi:MAG: transcription termination factor Rho [Lachnospiraceae bacterium]|nr:transcription termination factor Rho [Lachnospiraceae bacterium]